jgi:hypothetical protein
MLPVHTMMVYKKSGDTAHSACSEKEVGPINSLDVLKNRYIIWIYNHHVCLTEHIYICY